MQLRFGIRCTCLWLAFVPALLSAQAVHDGRSLGSEYEQAEKLQQAGRLSDAATHYRLFLAGAMAELARAYAAVPDYASAAPLYDEALSLEGDAPPLLLDYARAALNAGDAARARTLASESLTSSAGDRKLLAEGHQILGRALLRLNDDQQARKEFEAAVALDPTFPNGYDLAVACLNLSEEKCASQLFSEMQKSFGDTAELHLAFGRAYSDSDFQPQAIPELRRALEKNPRLPGAHYLIAVVLLATENSESPLAGAEAELKKEVEISPRSSMAYAALGKVQAQQRHYSEAETSLKKAIELDPQNPDPYLFLGQMYFETDRVDEAQGALQQCVQLTRDASRNRYQVQQAHYLLGRILMKRGDQDAAHREMKIQRELADKTLAQDKSKLNDLLQTADSGDNGVPRAQSAELVSTGAAANAEAARQADALRQRLRLPVADSYNNLGAIAATNSDFSGAVAFFKRAAEWNPSLEGLDYNLGRAAFAASQYEDAVAPLSRYLSAHESDAGARSALGISQFMTARYSDCIRTLEPVASSSDVSPAVQYAYAESLVNTGQLDRGTEKLIAIERAHPEVADVHRALGEAFARAGKLQQATDELHAAIQLNPNDGDAHYDLGKIELEHGKPADAVNELEAASRLSPRNAKIHEALADAYAANARPSDAQKQREIASALDKSTHTNASANSEHN